VNWPFKDPLEVCWGPWLKGGKKIAQMWWNSKTIPTKRCQCRKIKSSPRLCLFPSHLVSSPRVSNYKLWRCLKWLLHFTFCRHTKKIDFTLFLGSTSDLQLSQIIRHGSPQSDLPTKLAHGTSKKNPGHALRERKAAWLRHE